MSSTPRRSRSACSKERWTLARSWRPSGATSTRAMTCSTRWWAASPPRSTPRSRPCARASPAASRCRWPACRWW
ncbi:hypothetical protein APY03_3609 [Variovorax sp. WDL1]|nr:hypothetical protein APY03_3609 [Variovorax sp. WDL1]